MILDFDSDSCRDRATQRKQREYRTFAALAATAELRGFPTYGVQHARDAEQIERELLRERLPLWAASRGARPEEDV